VNTLFGKYSEVEFHYEICRLDTLQKPITLITSVKNLKSPDKEYLKIKVFSHNTDSGVGQSLQRKERREGGRDGTDKRKEKRGEDRKEQDNEKQIQKRRKITKMQIAEVNQMLKQWFSWSPEHQFLSL
jgi:hypothetical protein